MKRILGFLILGAVFGGMFAAMVLDKGLLAALLIWGAALGTTALICLGVRLAVDG